MARKTKNAVKKAATQAAPAARKISQIMTFSHGKNGGVFHVDLQTKPVAGKIVTAAINGRVNSVAITR